MAPRILFCDGFPYGSPYHLIPHGNPSPPPELPKDGDWVGFETAQEILVVTEEGLFKLILRDKLMAFRNKHSLMFKREQVDALKIELEKTEEKE